MADVKTGTARVLTLLGALVSAAACKDGAATARSKHDEPMTWERAEEIARQHWTEEGVRDGGTRPYTRNPRVKYLLKFLHLNVLVHLGEVVPENGGIAALARYLWEIPATEREGLQAEDLGELIGYFDAYPEVEGGSPWAYYDGSATHPWGADHPAIRPHIRWSGEQGLFRVYYNSTQNSGQLPDSFPRTLAEWTLTVSSDGSGTWSERERSYQLTEKRFVE